MRAAQYVRMSTEHQQYSIENQKSAIADYAQRKGFEVVATYSDSARSGIDLKHRAGLRKLLEDVVAGEQAFEAILVYDISRWGRFQDVDESAYYEFFCRRAGIQVHYCAEIFDSSDPGISAALLKALKRAMAGEYLRELSTKVFAGQCRLANQGYKLGGRAGYGLRRLLLDSNGNPKCVLKVGERKNLTTEHVTYIPGSEDEIKIIRWIYQMFLEEDLSIKAIARLLNLNGIPREVSNKWDYAAVHRILTHPKYVGSIVFNQSSQRLRTAKVFHSPEKWIVKPNCFEGLVPVDWFERAASKLHNRTVNKSNEQLISELRGLLQKEGRLTIPIILGQAGTASPSTYRHRFGSMRQSYVLAGCHLLEDMSGIHNRVRFQYMKDGLLQELTAACHSLSLPVIPNRHRHHCLAIWGHGEFRIGLAHQVQEDGNCKWKLSTLGWAYPRQPLILGILSQGNLRIERIALMFDPPNQKVSFRFHDDNIAKTAIVRETTAEIVAAIIAKQSIGGD
jgi:DNA invertase Pin-like site-specific DNA recombinase